MNKKNKSKNIILALVFLFLGFFLSTFYRPYIYENKIQDFGIADVGNNIVFIPAVYFLTLSYRGNYLWSKYGDIKFHLILLIILEISSLFFKGIGTFDFKDIIGLLIGAFLTRSIAKYAF